MMKHQLRLSPIVGAVVMALAAPVAMAAVPAANSLPGTFYTNQSSTTYTSTGSNAATIGINTSGPIVLQWGGSSATATASVAAPAGITTNAGFDIGAGATLGIDNGTATSAAVLINDITGQPSQIYGGLSATTNASLFVANGNGIVVGSGATITAPKGIALIGYAQSDSAFATGGAVTVDGATSTNAGTVTVAPGANLSGTTGFLLVAGAGTVNVGAAASSYTILAGTGFTANSTGGVTLGSAIQTASVLNLSGTLAPTTLAAAGNVNVAAGSNVTLAATTIGGAFSNSGNVSAATLTAGSILNAGTVTATVGALTATGTAGIVNNGIINAGSAALILTATNSAGAVITNNGVLKNGTGTLTFDASGTATNNGTIGFSSSADNSILVKGANITFNGTVNQATAAAATPSALSSTNALVNVTMVTPSTSAGVVNLGSSLFFTGTGTELSGAAVRVVSGGLVGAANSTLGVNLGSGKVGSYGYNLSLFPGTTLAAKTVTVTGTSGSNINLDGVLGNSNATAISVTGGNINASSNGGFAVASSATPPAVAALDVTFYGNLNNPNGSAVAGKPASAFQYNYVPVNVASAGTVIVNLTPKSTATSAQNVNMLVNGSVTLTPSALTAPLPQGGSTSVQGSYINNHLVVQATKNITVLGGGYWPGLVYLGTINAGTPGSLSSAGTITLNGALNNVLPANVSGSGGVFFMTSNPLGGTYTVTTNTNSWINFPAGGAGLANYYAATNPTSNYFYGAVINSSTPGVIGTQVLPSGDIQGR